jgi:pentatricopeptide repeat protein
VCINEKLVGVEGGLDVACLHALVVGQDFADVPTSVTYGTIVNALCRVSDERFAEEMFEEMESMPRIMEL